MAEGKVIAKRVTVTIPIEKFDEVFPIISSAGSSEKISVQEIYEQVCYWDVKSWDALCASNDVDPKDIHTIKVGDVWWQCRYSGINIDIMAFDKDDNLLIEEVDEDYEWREEFRDSISDYGLSGKQVLESLDLVISKYGYKLVSLDDGKKITPKYGFVVRQGMDS